MLKLTKQGAWVEVKYQTQSGEIRYMEQFYPSMKTGSRLVDDFTSDFLSKQGEVFLLDVKII